MKILITPLVTGTQNDQNEELAENIALMLKKQGHESAVCSPLSEDYPSPVLRAPFSLFNDSGNSYEDWQYSCGAIRRPFLQNDVNAVLDALEGFEAELIIMIDRLSALIAGAEAGVPVWSIVPPPALKESVNTKNILKNINSLLQEFSQEQIFAANDLLERSEQRIIFGAPRLAPCSEDAIRVGVCGQLPPINPPSTRLVIAFSRLSPRLNPAKVIREAFQGAPYDVFAWYEGAQELVEDNLHILAEPDYRLVSGAAAVIHDSTTFMTNLCAACGVPSLAVTDNSCERNFNAVMLRKTKTGLYIYEEEFSMITLYETFRKLMADDRYKENAREVRIETCSLGDIRELLKYL